MDPVKRLLAIALQTENQLRPFDYCDNSTDKEQTY